MQDEAHMRAALALARRGLGSTWPNPAVGCVLVRDGRVVGRGVTAPGGRPHAERVALDMAGELARGATAYVTLEPCNHTGRSPPCTDALIAAGVGRVVVAMVDPDPRVDGSGIGRLRAAGIPVATGLQEAEAEALQAGFLTRVRHGRPMVTLKLATTLDGRIATAAGESRWITGPDSRRAAHALRGQHDAILVGIGTVLADNPDLTCRIPGYRRSPELRIVADTRLRLDLSSYLVSTARTTPTWVLHGPGVNQAHCSMLEGVGVQLIQVEADESGLDLPAAMQALGQAGLTRLLVEGGARLAGSLVRAGLVDRLAWFHAPGVMGGEGLGAVLGFGAGPLDAMPRFERTGVRAVGPDVLTEFRRAA